MTDNLASNKSNGSWKFDAEVVEQFDAHVGKSVKGYWDIQEITTRLADWAAPDTSTVVDIGCSTGTTFAEIQKRHPDRAYKFVGYDNSSEMILATESKVAAIKAPESTLETYGDVMNGLRHLNADLTVSIFTLQFLPPTQRIPLLRALMRTSKPGGMLVVAEKTIPQDPRWALICAEASWEDKRVAGFPGDEIVAKAEALRGVLRPLEESKVIQEALIAGWEAPQLLWGAWNWRLYGFIAPDSMVDYE